MRGKLIDIRVIDKNSKAQQQLIVTDPSNSNKLPKLKNTHTFKEFEIASRL